MYMEKVPQNIELYFERESILAQIRQDRASKVTSWVHVAV
jgi:hypothetical protein